MEFFRRAPGRPRCLAVLAGTFNPPTRAHLGLAEAALARAGEVLFALPRVFPHKEYRGASFAERVEMLLAATAQEARFSVAAPERGLFLDIARECREAYPHDPAIAFLCGSDAARRVMGWDYGEPDAHRRMLKEFELWVADRAEVYEPPPEARRRVRRLAAGAEWREVSATEVRRRVAARGDWEHLVPEAIRGMVGRLYS
jgi:nicotinate (nicotinamide) nucleotide adenylyltransferase